MIRQFTQYVDGQERRLVFQSTLIGSGVYGLKTAVHAVSHILLHHLGASVQHTSHELCTLSITPAEDGTA